MPLPNDINQTVKDAQQAATNFEAKQVSSVKSNWKWLVGGIIVGLLIAAAVHALL